MNKKAVLLALTPFVVSPAAHAAIVSGTFTGQVTAVEDYAGIIGDDIQVSDIVTGVFSFDTSTPNNQSSGSSIGSYWHYGPTGGLSASINGLTFSGMSSFPVIVNVSNSNFDYISISQSASASDFPPGYGGYDNGVGIFMRDADGSAFDDTSLPLWLDASAFSSMSGQITSTDYFPSGSDAPLSPPPPRYEIFFSIDTVSTTSVPLPASILLMLNGFVMLMGGSILSRARCGSGVRSA